MARQRLRFGQIDLFTRRVRAADYARSASEFQLACSVADLLRRSCHPGWLWSHFPAGEAREHVLSKQGKRYSPSGARLERMGLQRGWPDYLLFAPDGKPYFLELKRGKRGRLSADQLAFRDWCANNGSPYEVAKTLVEAIVILRRWAVVRVTL